MNSETYTILNGIESNIRYATSNIYTPDLYRFQKLLNQLNERLERCASGTGKHNSKFVELKKEIKTSLEMNIPLKNIIKSKDYLRPLFDLYLNPDFFYKYRPSPDIFPIIERLLANSPLSTLGLKELCFVFFMNFKGLGNIATPLANIIKQQLSQYSSKKKLFGLAALKNDAENIFSMKGPAWLANFAINVQCKVAEILDSYKIPRDSGFYAMTEYIYIYEKLKGLNANEDSPVLDQVTDQKLCNTTVDSSGKLLGHYIIETLINKLKDANASPCDRWKNIILTIAGDPRVNESSHKFRIWWSVLGKEYVTLMRSWLSKYDMELFLNIIEKFCGNDPDKERMFRDRKKLLNHIFSKNDIMMSWLFIGKKVENELRKNLKKDEMPNFTRLIHGSGDVVFYYQVNGAHVIEGAHSFKMKILDRIPQKSPILQFKYETDIDELRSLLKDKYFEEFKVNYGGYNEFVHNGNWKIRVILELKRYGVKIDHTKFYTDEEYARYLRGF